MDTISINPRDNDQSLSVKSTDDEIVIEAGNDIEGEVLLAFPVGDLKRVVSALIDAIENKVRDPRTIDLGTDSFGQSISVRMAAEDEFALTLSNEDNEVTVVLDDNGERDETYDFIGSLNSL